MAIIVEHDKRKREILEKSMELFCKEGYEDVTFQKIADACGITRTTLYIYFKNKKEIFTFSIKQLSSDLEVKFKEIIRDTNLSAEECLRKVMDGFIDICSENSQMFDVLVQYLLNLKKKGGDAAERVRRRTIKVSHLINTVLIRGQKSGEFRKTGVKETSELLFNLVTNAVFSQAVLENDTESSKKSINLVIDGLLNS